MLRNNQQNKTLHALLSKLNINLENKEQLAYNFSNGRTCKTSLLTIPECQALINHLQHLQNMQPKVIPGDKMRKKIISICHELGWQLKNGKVDINKVNHFCEQRSYLKKQLNSYTLNELPALVSQFEKILKAHYNAKKA